MTADTALAGRRALVTGASSGVGRACAQVLAGAGAEVLATGRSREGLAATVLGRPGIRTVAGDLTDESFVGHLAAEAGAVDILVNNAGRLKHAPVLTGRLEDWRAVFELNVLSLLALTQAVATRMAERGSGHIVLISSLLARRVAPFTTVYAASKHAVAAIAAGLRLELGPKGVAVTEVAPGLVSTGILDDIDDPAVLSSYADSRERFAWLSPADVAAALLYAVSARPGSVPELIELRPQGQP